MQYRVVERSATLFLPAICMEHCRANRLNHKLYDMKLLEGKTAVITGAARGIGKAIALTFAREGANVAFSDMVRNEAFEQTEKELNALGVKAKGYTSDASSLTDSEKFIDEVAADFGRIDVLVNNAGITRDALLMRMTEEQWDLKQKFGSIINMSSVVGVAGNAGQSNYSASKAGMIGFTKSIAQELGSRNIRTNAIAPGFIITDMTGVLSEEVRKGFEARIPLRRGGTPQDVANVALFLASDLSSYVNGQVINVCGGMTM